MPARVTHHVDKRALQMILSSPNGAVAKDLFRRGKKVEAKAKKNLNESPRRIDTGTLRSSINTQLLSLGGKPVVQVGTNLFYAIYVHEGTGIYGPKGRPITPKTAKMLSWKNRKGARIFAKSVKGMKPNPFLKNALMAAKD
jgi:HK97 gp10 family phage protein